jgi:DNA/RNA endonuclease YhcR with UshA esterase domain
MRTRLVREDSVRAVLPRLAGIVAVASLVAGTAHAHHSIGGEFDAAKQIEVRGIVKELHLINPHAYILLDVEQEDGTGQQWVLSMGPATKLIRGSGWTPDILKPGERVTAVGRAARRGNGLYVIELVKADGTHLIEELQE